MVLAAAGRSDGVAQRQSVLTSPDPQPQFGLAQALEREIEYPGFRTRSMGAPVSFESRVSTGAQVMDGMPIDLPRGIHLVLLQAGGGGSSLDELSTAEVIGRTLIFLAVLAIAGWFARRLKK
jgi:hypothetical protein